VESERLEGGRLEAVVKKLEGLEGYKVPDRSNRQTILSGHTWDRSWELEARRLEAVVKKLEGLEGYKVEMSRCRESRAGGRNRGWGRGIGVKVKSEKWKV
jgi:hypothetical protein